MQKGKPEQVRRAAAAPQEAAGEGAARRPARTRRDPRTGNAPPRSVGGGRAVDAHADVEASAPKSRSLTFGRSADDHWVLADETAMARGRVWSRLAVVVDIDERGWGVA